MSFAATIREEALDHAVRSGNPQSTALEDYARHLLGVHGTYVAIAGIYGCSQPNVSMFMKRIGFGQNNRLNAQQKNLILTLQTEGVSVPVMRERKSLANVKPNTIYQFLRRNRVNQSE